MTARIHKLLSSLRETFWIIPGLMVLAGILAAVSLVALDRSGIVQQSLLGGPWLYNGGGTGARTLLGAVASSTIGVAGTVFSITIAALTLAAGQMGPRLLRNFVRDRGNQITLGAFLGTFSYALMVLRSVRTQGEGEFVPRLSLSIAILLAFVCVRPGDYVFPGAPIAVMTPSKDHAAGAIRNATALGAQRTSSGDLEFAVRQLVEIAVRALSPGINDPNTAMSVLDRLGTALCDLVPLKLPTGVSARNGKAALVVPAVVYDGVVDSMFHMIRQNARGSTAVLIRMLEVLTAVVSCEGESNRRRTLRRHAGLVLSDAERDITTAADLLDVRKRYERFLRMAQHGSTATISEFDH